MNIDFIYIIKIIKLKNIFNMKLSIKNIKVINIYSKGRKYKIKTIILLLFLIHSNLILIYIVFYFLIILFFSSSSFCFFIFIFFTVLELYCMNLIEYWNYYFYFQI